MHSKVTDRIEKGEACDFITLTKQEDPIYTGAGWHLAQFKDGVLAGLLDLFNLVEVTDDPNEEANAILTAALKWRDEKQDDGEIYLVMCSCYTLCDPLPLVLGSEAKLARIIGDAVVKNRFE